MDFSSISQDNKSCDKIHVSPANIQFPGLNSQHCQQDNLNWSGIVIGFRPTLQDNMANDKIHVSPANIQTDISKQF